MNNERLDNKSTTIELPLKISLTEEAMGWFIKNKKKLSRLQMAGSRIEYGISLQSTTVPSLQKMINFNYVSVMEVARNEFLSKRNEILDLTKLITYQILYKKYEQEVANIFLNTSLIQHWNRNNPKRIIDMDSTINRKFVECFLEDSKEEIDEVKTEITAPLLEQIMKNENLSEDEWQVDILRAEKFIQCIPSSMWCILVKSKGLPEYSSLINDVRTILGNYLEKCNIPEYLSLMVLELLTYTEKTHYLQTMGELLPHYGEKSRLKLIMEPKIRELIQKKLDSQKDSMYLTFQIGAKKASIGTACRLQITIFNREKEYRETKKQIEEKMDIETKGKSLLNFYEEDQLKGVNQELGLYYLSYLHDACEKHNIRFESAVNKQTQEFDQTIINMVFNF